MKLTFLGANRQVTGSRHFLEAGGLRILIDSGLFQERSYEDRNWQPCPVDPKSIDLLLLTHAHLDHCGLLPKLVREGFRGSIYATPTTIELAEIVMNDSARINEEDAIRKAERHAAEGRKPRFEDKPLYTLVDAAKVPPLFRPIRYDTPTQLNEHVSVRYFEAGHILGSASIEITVTEASQSRTIVFSGDIGMPDRPILRDPVPPDHADYLIMESTYGDRDHNTRIDVKSQLAKVITDTVSRKGNIVIPTFAIERAQELMYMLSELIEENRIPHLLVFLDSPMAINATEVFRKHRDVMDEAAIELYDQGKHPFAFEGLHTARSADQSKAINHITGSVIILAGSGMATGGRIKHHLVNNIGRPECTILFVGYQAAQTLGRVILQQPPEVRIFGKMWPRNAHVEQIHGLSAHADRKQLLAWAAAPKKKPARMFLTHGEQHVSEQLAERLRQDLGYTVDVPSYTQSVEL